MTDVPYRKTTNGFPLLPNYAIADLTSDMFSGHAHEIGLPHEGILEAARGARDALTSINSTNLNVYDIQEITSDFLELVTSRLDAADRHLFSIWFESVSPHMNVYQPVIDGWGVALLEQASGLYGDVPPPAPADSVMALMGTLVDHLPSDEGAPLSDWDSQLAETFGSHDGDVYDVRGALTTTISSSSARYLWSWAASRVENPNWNALGDWARGSAADWSPEDREDIDLGNVLPLPAVLYDALPQGVQEQ